MKTKVIFRIAITLTAIFMLILFNGCGLTGSTSIFTLDYNLKPKLAISGDSIVVGSVSFDMDAAKLLNVNCFDWGKMDKEDIGNIEHSLKNTIAHWQAESPKSSTNSLQIHVVVRRYFLQTSTSNVAGLVKVAWCAAYDSQNIIYHEEFYAADSGELIYTIGMIKNSIHEAIVNRIARNAFLLSSNLGNEFIPASVQNTYLSFDEAVSTLPEALFTRSGTKQEGDKIISWYYQANINWDWTKHTNVVNWPELISTFQQ